MDHCGSIRWWLLHAGACVAIKKRKPFVFPPYKWDESAHDWSGVCVQGSLASQLPIAYLVSHILLETGADPFFVGKYANRLNYAPRRPNVLLCEQNQYEAFSSSPEFVDMLNRNGVIVANIQAFTPPSGNSEFGDALQGIPVKEISGYNYPKSPDKYVGGRLFVLHNSLNPLLSYVDYTIPTEDITYTAPPGSSELCALHGWGPGSIGLDATYSISGDAILNGYYTDRIEAVRAQSLSIRESFDRLCVYFATFPVQPEEQTWTSQYTCYDGIVHDVHGPTPALAGEDWTGPVLSVVEYLYMPKLRLFAKEVASRLLNDVFKTGDTIDYGTIIDFFDT